MASISHTSWIIIKTRVHLHRKYAIQSAKHPPPPPPTSDDSSTSKWSQLQPKHEHAAQMSTLTIRLFRREGLKRNECRRGGKKSCNINPENSLRQQEFWLRLGYTFHTCCTSMRSFCWKLLGKRRGSKQHWCPHVYAAHFERQQRTTSAEE